MSEGKDKTFEVVGKTIAAVDALSEALRNSEHAWHWKKLQEYATGLFDRAPFKAGDRVRLTVTPEINEKDSWGWMGSKHFLVKGAVATVHSVDFRDGKFNALLYFDDETWKDDAGVLRKKDRASLYHFWETKLERVPPCSTSAPTPPSGKGEP